MAKPLSIIVAFDRNRLIGAKNQLPWHLPADLKRFKELTTGNATIMGRGTYISIGRALPNRRNIVLTTQPDFKAEGCQVAHTLAEAIKMVKPDEEAFIIGGAQVYRQALPLADKLYVTHVKAEFKGDVYFPKFNLDDWREVWRRSNPADKINPYEYTFSNYVKKS